MPFVAANFRTREGAAHRATIGLSMGGGQSLTIGLKHPGRFAWVGGMSSSAAISGASVLFADATALNRQLKLLWFACGKEDFLRQANQELSATMQAKNVRHIYVETEGNHSWPVWRKYLADFVPLIFRETKS